MFLCNGGKGFKGEFVYIRDDREAGAGVEYFSLCEVQVFGMPGQKTFHFTNASHDCPVQQLSLLEQLQLVELLSAPTN